MTNGLRLTKRLPARTKTVELRWVRTEFMEHTERFRELRERVTGRRNTDRHCWWCGHPFELGEMMALAGVHGQGNKLLCSGCAGQVEVS